MTTSSRHGGVAPRAALLLAASILLSAPAAAQLVGATGEAARQTRHLTRA